MKFKLIVINEYTNILKMLQQSFSSKLYRESSLDINGYEYNIF